MTSQPFSPSTFGRAGWGVRATAILVLIALLQLVYFFGVHLDVFNHQIRTTTDAQDAVFRALDFPPDTYVHIVGDVVFYDFDIMRMETFYRRPDLQTRVVRHTDEGSEFTAAYLASLPRDHDHAFFIAVGAEDDIALLRQYFDVEGPFYSPYNVPIERQFELYYAEVP
jgi:hypothetical protein